MDGREGRQKREGEGHSEPVQVYCPKCGHTEIVYIPREEIPLCPRHKKRMLVKEILTEGKYY
ncbi:hypothetical protein [Desulfohalovibrio reitneri]|uniref:hypothetical protein n=1 Tax=Desulfohalovibrio reitneri TaxID=1307759 RepID=UPI0004A71662|nr:hypothetical protein [Desulfohalovibrio reitneri]